MVSMEEAIRVARAAARGFKLYKCFECADSIRNEMTRLGQPGEVIVLRAAGHVDLMACLSYDGGRTSITQTGVHCGVRIGDLVFDNLHPDGLPYQDWLNDFAAMTSVRIERVESF